MATRKRKGIPGRGRSAIITLSPWPQARSQVFNSISGSAEGPARTQNSKSSNYNEQGYHC